MAAAFLHLMQPSGNKWYPGWRFPPRKYADDAIRSVEITQKQKPLVLLLYRKMPSAILFVGIYSHCWHLFFLLFLYLESNLIIFSLSMVNCSECLI